MFTGRRLSVDEQSFDRCKRKYLQNKVGWGKCMQTRSEMQVQLISLQCDGKKWRSAGVDFNWSWKRKSQYWPCCCGLKERRRPFCRERSFSVGTGGTRDELWWGFWSDPLPKRRSAQICKEVAMQPTEGTDMCSTGDFLVFLQDNLCTAKPRHNDRSRGINRYMWALPSRLLHLKVLI